MRHDRLDARIARQVDEQPMGSPSARHPLLDLQRTAGNAAVQRMLVQREEATAAPGWAAQVGDWLFPPTEGEKHDTGASPGAPVSSNQTWRTH